MRQKKKTLRQKLTLCIRKITENRYIKEYVCGDKKMSIKEYEEQKTKLLSKVTYDDFDEHWETLEDEFAYRKFNQLWTPIYTVEQELSEPLLVQIKKIKFDTGNKYITNSFLNGEDQDLTLFTYDQHSAWLGIVHECFKELEMEYFDHIGYVQTSNKKIWGNASHSCIRYVVAFGSYVFGQEWENARMKKGTLTNMKKCYKEDREKIRKIIIDKYNNHFGCIDVGKFDFDTLKSILTRAQASLADVDPKQKSYTSYERAKKALVEAQEMIKAAYEVKKDISYE